MRRHRRLPPAPRALLRRADPPRRVPGRHQVVLVNDLYSVAKDLEDAKPPCNMVLQVAADRGCSIDEATEVTVQLHNDLVRDFEASHRELQAVPSVELQRFLRALRAWMGGAFEWHDSNPRYKTGRKP
ncbi:hypothetical protein OV203_45710 [Nannocystis sp. ILAH1]|nr:hypothetical protein [Nannocystis sp. ILAH1]